VKGGVLTSVVSAWVGVIAAPMIFELPFDLIVMLRVHGPAPEMLFNLLYFIPYIMVELLSFALLSLSPFVCLSRYTLFLLAAMFLIFALWALFGFTYPQTPISIALNMLSKVIAFAACISLFLPQQKSTQENILPQQEVG
jgi:hypothetical protein